MIYFVKITLTKRFFSMFNMLTEKIRFVGFLSFQCDLEKSRIVGREKAAESGSRKLKSLPVSKTKALGAFQ